jgi:hypothetical protein
MTIDGTVPLWLVAGVIVWLLASALIDRSVQRTLRDTEDGVPRRLPFTWPSFSRRRYDRLSTEEKKAWWKRQRAGGNIMLALMILGGAAAMWTQNVLLAIAIAPFVFAAFLYSQLGGRLPRG